MYHNSTSSLQVAESSFSSLPSKQGHFLTFLLPSLATVTPLDMSSSPHPSLPLHVSTPTFPTVTALQVFIIDPQGQREEKVWVSSLMERDEITSWHEEPSQNSGPVSSTTVVSLPDLVH